MENKSNFYSGQFRPYWLPSNQPCQPPVLVIRIPVPVSQFATSTNWSTNNQCRTYKQEHYKWQKKSKRKTQKCRDILRRQKFIENKVVCSALPFSELSDEEFKTAVPHATDPQEERLRLQLNAFEAAVGHLKKENEDANSSNISLMGRLSDETRELQKATEEIEQLKSTVAVLQGCLNVAELGRQITNEASEKLRGIIKAQNQLHGEQNLRIVELEKQNGEQLEQLLDEKERTVKLSDLKLQVDKLMMETPKNLNCGVKDSLPS